MMRRKNCFIIIGITAGIYLFIRFLLPVSTPFIVGWILALLVFPLSVKVSRSKLGRRFHVSYTLVGCASIFLIVAMIILLFWWILNACASQINTALTYFPSLQSELQTFINDCCCTLEKVTGIMAEDSSRFLYNQAAQLKSSFLNTMNPENMMGSAVSSIKICIVVISAVLLSVVSGVLFVKDFELFRDRLRNYSLFQKMWNVLKNLVLGARSFIKSQVKIMTLIAVLCVVAFYLLKIPHFLIKGIGLGLVDALPVLGTGTVLIPWALLLFLKGNTALAVGILVLYLVTSSIRQFLEPKLIGDSLGISPIFVLASMYFGIFIFGGGGFLLGPVSAMLLWGMIKEWNLTE